MTVVAEATSKDFAGPPSSSLFFCEAGNLCVSWVCRDAKGETRVCGNTFVNVRNCVSMCHKNKVPCMASTPMFLFGV